MCRRSCLRYATGTTAGIQMIDPVTASRVVHFGFPIETMIDPSARARLLRQSLAFLLEPMPLGPAPNAPLGQRLDLKLTLPSEGGRLYMFFASESASGGVTLPGGGVLPLQPAALFAASLDPGNPFFGDFLGILDGNGTAAPFVDVPNLAFLAGMDVWFAGFTLDTTTLIERELTNWTKTTLGP